MEELETRELSGSVMCRNESIGVMHRQEAAQNDLVRAEIENEVASCDALSNLSGVDVERREIEEVPPLPKPTTVSIPNPGANIIRSSPDPPFRLSRPTPPMN